METPPDATLFPMPSAQRWTRLSLVSQIVLLVYLEAIEWIDLFPWNNIRHGNDQQALDIALGGDHGWADSPQLAQATLGHGRRDLVLHLVDGTADPDVVGAVPPGGGAMVEESL